MIHHYAYISAKSVSHPKGMVRVPAMLRALKNKYIFLYAHLLDAQFLSNSLKNKCI